MSECYTFLCRTLIVKYIQIISLDQADADFQNLTNFRVFKQTFLKRIESENPTVPLWMVFRLVAAKWKEFAVKGNIDMYNDAAGGGDDVAVDDEEDAGGADHAV